MKDIYVAPDGSRDYTSVQSAIDAVTDGPHTHIHILPGVYHERIMINREGLTLSGEDPETCILTFDACAKDLYPDGREKGTFLSASVLVAATNVTLKNLTVRNDAGDGREVGQAVALYWAGDRGVCSQCHLTACQDTLFCGPIMERVLVAYAPRTPVSIQCVESVGDCPETTARVYFDRCTITGDVDFIFGPYRCWFEQCTLVMNERGGWYTAANTPREQPFGFVFHRCHLTGHCLPRLAYLGRPWRYACATTFLSCRMEECVSPVGFMDWDEIRVVTERCQEYGTTGARADTSVRHPHEKILSADEAAAITPEVVLNGWVPCL